MKIRNWLSLVLCLLLFAGCSNEVYYPEKNSDETNRPAENVLKVDIPSYTESDDLPIPSHSRLKGDRFNTAMAIYIYTKPKLVPIIFPDIPPPIPCCD